MFVAWFSLAWAAPGVAAPGAREAPRTVRVVLDNNYPPYSYQSDDGKLQGILVDQWKAWESRTGIKVEIHAADWVEALRRMRAGDFDVIDSIFETPERRAYFDFTPAYFTVEASIFFRKDISGITDLDSLKGFPIGVKAGDQHIDKLKQYGVATVIPFQNYDAIVASAKQRKISVFLIDNPSAFYALHKMGIEADFRHSAPMFRDELRRAVRKGNAPLLDTVSAGELRKIDEKWFGQAVKGHWPYLNYAGYAAGLAILLIAGLATWNRTLRTRVLERTVALNESENHLRLVIDRIPVMAWSLLPEGAVEFLNQRWLDYTGLSLKEALKDANGIVHADDLPWVMERWLVDKAAEKPSEYEMRLRGADGEYRWFLVRTVPLFDERGKLVRWYGTSTDIEDRKRAEDALRESGDQLQALSRRMVDLQESERKELARELHDRVGQNLTALKINIDILQPALGSEGNAEVVARVADSAALLESTMDTIENVMSELRPPMLDHHGLAAALEWHARNFSRRTGIAVAVRAREPAMRPAPQTEIALFRIAQEALNNIAKHARAKRAEIALNHANGECVMSVQDDGIGIGGVEDEPPKPKAGFGMVTMRERAQAVGGRFEVRALPVRGTQITVRVPY